MKRGTMVYLAILMVLSISTKTWATTYLDGGPTGKEITKGQAVKLAMAGKKVVKIDYVKWDDEKGSLRNLKKSESK